MPSPKMSSPGSWTQPNTIKMIASQQQMYKKTLRWNIQNMCQKVANLMQYLIANGRKDFRNFSVPLFSH